MLGPITRRERLVLRQRRSEEALERLDGRDVGEAGGPFLDRLGRREHAEPCQARAELDPVRAGLRERRREVLEVGRDEVLPILHRDREDVVILLEGVERALRLVEVVSQVVELLAEPLERAHRGAEAVLDGLFDVRVGDRVRDERCPLRAAVFDHDLDQPGARDRAYGEPTL